MINNFMVYSSFKQFLFRELDEKDYTKVADFAKKVEENPKENSPWFNHLFDDKLRVKIPFSETEAKIKEIEKILNDPEGHIDWNKGTYTVGNRMMSLGRKLLRAKAPKELIDWVSQFLNINPENRQKFLNSKQEIVITRHPVDVVRMSDLEGIDSCHSPDGSYFDCAVKDANNGNMVAYLVEKGKYDTQQSIWTKKRKNWNDPKDNELDNDDWRPASQLYNFDQGEMFGDEKRKVKGPNTVLARLRIRRFDGYVGKKKVHLAVPEKRVYPDWNQEFYDSIMNWAKSTQKEILSADVSQLKNFTLYGGAYLDTDASELINDIFGKEVADKILNKDTNALAIRTQKEEMERIKNSVTFKHAYTKWEFQRDGVGGIRGGFHFKISRYLPIEFDEKNFTNINALSVSELQDYIKSYQSSIPERVRQILKESTAKIYKKNNKIIFLISFNEGIYDPNYYNRLITDLKLIDDNYDQIKNLIIEWILKPHNNQHSNHNIWKIITKYFDVKTQESSYVREPKMEWYVFSPKNTSQQDHKGYLWGLISDGKFSISVVTSVHKGNRRFNLPKEEINLTDSPWKEIMNLFPTNYRTNEFINAKHEIIQARLNYQIPLGIDDFLAEKFMMFISNLYQRLPWIQQQSELIILKSLGTTKELSNYNKLYPLHPEPKPFSWSEHFYSLGNSMSL